MKNLLTLEFRRLLRSKTFYICLGISLIMILITAGTNKLLLKAINTEEMEESFGLIMQSPTSLSMMKGIGSSSFLMILAVFITIFVTEDYAGNTIKNIYAKGYSRDLVFFSKYLSVLSACFSMIVVDLLFSMAMGGVLFGDFGSAGHFYAGSLVAVIFVLLSYITVFFMVAICMRKLGAALPVSLVGPVVLSLILTLITALSSDKFRVSDYWLDGILTNLAEYDVSGKNLVIAFVMGFNMLAGSLLISFFANRKKDQ